MNPRCFKRIALRIYEQPELQTQFVHQLASSYSQTQTNPCEELRIENAGSMVKCIPALSNYCLDFLSIFAKSLKKLTLPHFIMSEDATESLLNLHRLDELSVERLSFDDDSCNILGKYLFKLYTQIREIKKTKAS
jgi:hypothetical protein